MIIGIDPGKNGAAVALFDGGTVVDVCRFSKSTVFDIAEFFKTQIDTAEQAGEPLTAFLEKNSSRPQQGVVAVFTFGRGYGQLEGILAALEIRWEYVTPPVWQRGLRCLTGGNKNISKAAAQRLFPKQKIVHGNADAFLIAEFGRRRINYTKTGGNKK